MADDSMSLLETLRKVSADGEVDVLRDAVRLLAHQIMEAEVTQITAVAKGERDPEHRHVGDHQSCRGVITNSAEAPGVIRGPFHWDGKRDVPPVRLGLLKLRTATGGTTCSLRTPGWNRTHWRDTAGRSPPSPGSSGSTGGPRSGGNDGLIWPHRQRPFRADWHGHFSEMRRLRNEFPDQPERWLCAETIYQAVYWPDLGGLPRELPGRVLRLRRRQRLARRHARARRAGPLTGMTLIHDRPAEALGREQPGHWEGDQIVGAGNASAVVTIVQPRTGRR